MYMNSISLLVIEFTSFVPVHLSRYDHTLLLKQVSVFKKTPTVPLLCIIIPFVILELCRLLLKQIHQKQEIITNENNSHNYNWLYLYVRNENPTYWNGTHVTQTLLKCQVRPPSLHLLLTNQKDYTLYASQHHSVVIFFSMNFFFIKKKFFGKLNAFSRDPCLFEI